MKIKQNCLSLLNIFFFAGTIFAQQTITIKGKVQFPDNRSKMVIYERQGFDKLIIDSCGVKDDGSYEFKMNVDKPGVYVLDCQKWQSVPFWAEDENLEIDFRGQDTAKIVIKNPPYVHIKGGRNNELMNLFNWDSYRGYQLMVGVSQRVYRIPGINDQTKQDVSGKFYSLLSDESRARLRYIATHYSDRNSILFILPMLSREEDEQIVNNAVSVLENKNSNYPPLLKYKKDAAEAKILKEQLSEGKTAPEFSYRTANNKKTLGPQDFKGKILVLDFWASWCGPCRKEIQHLKEIYEKFTDKGVAFFSVSIDDNETDWKGAMKEENMPWEQALAPNSGKKIMTLYQFSGIPYIIILDKDGKIISKNLRGKELADKLENLTK